MNKLITTIIAVVVIVGGGAFYGGMKYTESKSPRDEFSRTNFQDHSQEFSANVSGAFGGDHEGGSGFRGRRFGSGADGSRSLTGEVISQSDDSLTIKLSDGSTKIVFINDSTQITKSVEGSLDDFSEGEQIFVGGTENPDGSYTAQTIQLRPFDHIQ